MVNDGNVTPVILLSKTDLVEQPELDSKIEEIRNSGITCELIPYSIKTGSGLQLLKNLLKPSTTYCLLGSSGVGKTTLLNHLIGKQKLKTNEIREKDSKGRHTTSRRQLIKLDNGAMVIDTPGMRELGNIDIELGIEESFSEILHLSSSCRFNNCTHTHEIGCSVLKAVQDGSLSKTHYEDYLKLKKESEYQQMSYVEKRRKDKEFGRYVKSVMKHLKNSPKAR
jgi:ribosome biogenesis GTPase